MHTLVPQADVLSHFNISSATLANWVKNHLPHAKQAQGYDMAMIQSFVDTHGKLASRANKKKATGLTVPKSLLGYLTLPTEWVRTLPPFFGDHFAQDLVELLRLRARKGTIPKHLQALDAHIPDELYSIGVAYQASLNDGERSRLGAYYTPFSIVSDVVTRLFTQDRSQHRMLEPCAGSGFFAVEYTKRYHAEYRQWPTGLITINDIDPIAAQITSYTLDYLTQCQMIHTMHAVDGLTLPYRQHFDLILTNPPYGIKNTYPTVKNTDIFTHFMHKGLHDYCKDGGECYYILPESVTNVDKHQDIRDILNRTSTLHRLQWYGKTFDGVMSDIIGLHYQQRMPTAKDTITIQRDTVSHTVPCLHFQTPGQFWTDATEQDRLWCDQVAALPHENLKNSFFGLGVVTGNNAVYLHKTASAHHVRALAGKEVSAYRIDDSAPSYLKLTEWNNYQQKIDRTFFTQPKLIYRFICDQLVVYPDTAGMITLNSANIIIPKQMSVSLTYVAAVLNSAPMQRYYALMFGRPLKVLKAPLQQLPIWITDTATQDRIEQAFLAQNMEDVNLLLEAWMNLPKEKTA